MWHRSEKSENIGGSQWRRGNIPTLSAWYKAIQRGVSMAAASNEMTYHL